MKRITKGVQFLGQYWVYLVLGAAFILSIVFGDVIAAKVPGDSILVAIPAVIVMGAVLYFFIYSYRRNN